MNSFKFIFGLSACAMAGTLSSLAQSYDIRLDINCCRNDTMLIGHYFTKMDLMFSDDTTKADKAGHAVFRGKDKLAKGLYFFAGGNRKLLDFIVGDEQKFEISTDTSSIIDKSKCKNSRDNEIFFAFQKMNKQKSIRMEELMKEYKAADSTAKREVAKKLQTLTDERYKEIWQLMQEGQGLYIYKFLNPLIPIKDRVPVEKPEFPWQNALPEGSSSWTADSVNNYRYYWYRNHYFDNLNVLDPDMLRTPLYEEKLLDYFTKTSPAEQEPDSICAKADKLIAKAAANEDVQRYIATTLWNYYIKSKYTIHENVWVHLAEQWLPLYAKWFKPDYVETIKKEVEKRKPNLINQPAPPLEFLTVLPPDHFKVAQTDTAIKFDIYAGRALSDFRKSIKGKYIALFFWDAHCGHCQKTIKELHDEYEKLKDKGLVVITIMTVNSREAKGQWVDFVNKNNLYDWINAWSPSSVDFHKLYNISSVPQLYLLDENDIIIGKQLSPEQLEKFIR